MAPLTVAVKVTACPAQDGLGDTVSVVVVAVGWAVTVTDLEAEAEVQADTV